MLKIDENNLKEINGGSSNDDYLYVLQHYGMKEAARTTLTNEDVGSLFLGVKLNGLAAADWLLGTFDGIDVMGNYQFNILYGLTKNPVINPAGYTFMKAQEVQFSK